MRIRESGKGLITARDIRQQLPAPLSLAIIFMLFASLSPYFFTVGNILNIGRQAAINLIIALGMTVVIVSAGIDLSVGSICALSMCTMAQLFGLGYIPNIWLAMIVGIAVGTLTGVSNGLIIHFGNIPPFVATLGMMGIARGLTLVITRGSPWVYFPKSFQWIGGGEIIGIPFPLILASGIAVVFWFVLKFFPLGRHFFAIGGNEEAARVSGVRIGYTKILAYTISGLCSAIAGIVLASRINTAPPNSGIGYELTAIAAVIIGGTNLFGGEGTVGGTVTGALIMTTIGNGLHLLGVSPFWQQVAIGAILVLAVLLRTVSGRRR